MKRIFVAAFTALALTACNDASTSAKTALNDSANMNNNSNSEEAKEERNKQVALASENAFGSGDVDAIFKDVDKDQVDYGDGSMKPIKGLDSSKAALKMYMAAVPDFKGSDFIAVADGDYVMVYGTWSGTWKNDFMGQKATGKSFKLKDVDIFKFNDAGKIIEHRFVHPMSDVAHQLGMKMPTQ